MCIRDRNCPSRFARCRNQLVFDAYLYRFVGDRFLLSPVSYTHLCEALEVLTAWGFSYKTVAFVWVKQNRKNDDLFTGMGYWTRANAEICILATKGHPKRVDAGVRQVILSHIEEHSKKPDEARERIVRLMGDLPRVELFARQSPEGWDVWGNEVECTAHLPMEETPCCG